MAQRPITAFFSKPKPKTAAETVEVKPAAPLKETCEKLDEKVGCQVSNGTPTKNGKRVSLADEAANSDDSPVKMVSKKRAKFLDSDEDSRDSESKKFKHEVSSSGSSSSDEAENPSPKLVVKLAKKPPKLKGSSSALSDSSPEKTSLKAVTKPMTEPPKANIKTEAKSPQTIEKPKSPKAVAKIDKSPKAVARIDKSPKAVAKTDKSAKAVAKTKAESLESNGEVEEAETAVAVDVNEYNPLRSNYHPIKDAGWKVGEKVPYMALARTLSLIEETSSRLKMIEILANYLRSVIVLSPDDLLCSVYLCLNQLAPAYVGLELGVGDGIIIKALAQATGRAADKVKADAAAKGDLGLVAESSKGTQKTLFMFKPASLTVRSVFDKLTEIASMTGNSSQGKKVDMIHRLLVASKQLEARYITRSLAGKLRIGLAEQSLLQSLAMAATLTPANQTYPPAVLNSCKGLSAEAIKARIEENALLVKTAYCQCPSYDRIVPVLLREGVQALPEHCTLTAGVPLKPMLACPTRGIGEVLQRFESCKFTCEWKYDGERAQIHLLDTGDVRIYSRNQENNTSKYPDIIGRFSSWLKPAENVKSAILDTEAVAWDTDKKQILPFQVLSTRKRKDAVEADIKVQVCVFAFDMLLINGESLVQQPLVERRRRMHQAFQTVEGQFHFATGKDPESMEEIEEFLDESIKGNCEGLMVKALDVKATYEIARRSHNWLKLKKDYLEGVGDTIDAVVIGGYLGKGKRTGLYGGFLIACYDDANEEYQTLCKLGTGFSDEDFQKHSEFLKDHVIQKPKSYYQYDASHAPDHWFEPVQVWEIKCADLSISPVHRAAVGIIDPVKGISLRFPRFLRIREDKNPEDATSAAQIAELYQNQDQVKNQKGGNDDEEGFY